jgi:hypothetical protein
MRRGRMHLGRQCPGDQTRASALRRLTVQGDLFSPVLDTDQQLPPLR